VRLLNRSAGRLSRHRRGPLAGLVVLLLGLMLTGGLYAAFSPAQAEQTGSSAAQVAQGRQLFLVSCSFCHGQNGEGVRSQDGHTQLGPSLIGVGAAAVDFQVGTGRMPMTQPGAQVPRKPRAFDDQEIAALAAYVASLGPGPAIPTENDYSIDGLSASEKQDAIARGGYAPKIRGVAPKYIYEALLTGPQNMPNFTNGNLSPDEKRDVIAYLGSLDQMKEYGGFGLGGLGPVTEGLAAWLVGLGLCVGFAVWIAAHTTRTNKKKVDA
jgi:ubiquinol-cytochrome c reductase cytochrome c subunit